MTNLKSISNLYITKIYLYNYNFYRQENFVKQIEMEETILNKSSLMQEKYSNNSEAYAKAEEQELLAKKRAEEEHLEEIRRRKKPAVKFPGPGIFIYNIIY